MLTINLSMNPEETGIFEGLDWDQLIPVGEGISYDGTTLEVRHLGQRPPPHIIVPNHLLPNFFYDNCRLEVVVEGVNTLASNDKAKIFTQYVTGQAHNTGFYFEYDGPNRMALQMSDTGGPTGGTVVSLSNPSNPPKSRTIVYERKNGTNSFYIDGALALRNTYTNSARTKVHGLIGGYYVSFNESTGEGAIRNDGWNSSWDFNITKFSLTWG